MLELCRFRYLKKRRKNSSSLPNLVQLLLDDSKANISNTNNTKDESGTQSWYKSTNESYFSSKEERYSYMDIEKLNLKREQSSYKKLAKLESEPREIIQNKKRTTKLQGNHRNELHTTLIRKKNRFEN